MHSKFFIILAFVLILFLHLNKSHAQTDNSHLQPPYRLTLSEDAYDIHTDQTFIKTSTKQYQLLTQVGIDNFKQVSLTYNPDSQKIVYANVYITQPSGISIKVPEENVQIAPLSADSRAAHLTNKKVMLITLPKLMLGCKVTLISQIQNIKPNLFGFFISDSPIFDIPNKKRVIKLTFPIAIPMHVIERGGYHITRSQSKEKVTITAQLSDQPAHYRQIKMVNESDVVPLFSASTLDSWQQLGDIFFQTVKDKVVVNEEISNLAKSVVGNQKGLAAAQAIYNWIMHNIYYIAVNLNANDNYVPQSSVETLKNRFGDCKAIVILLQALYKTISIKSQAVLVGWDNKYNPYPLANPAQFNHIILYLPDYNLFLNSTDRYAPFGILHPNLQNKLIVITDIKSVVSHTPLDNPRKNSYRVDNKTILQNNGSLSGETRVDIKHTLGADFRSSFAMVLTEQFSSKQMANNKLRNTVYGGFGNLHISDVENLNLPFKMDAHWESPHAVNMDKDLFLLIPEGVQPTSISDTRSHLIEGKLRYPILTLPSVYYWHDIILVPSQYHIQSLPHPIKLSNSAGSYISQYQSISPSKIEVTRHLLIKKDIYTPDTYKDFKLLLQQSTRDARNILYFKQDQKTPQKNN